MPRTKSVDEHVFLQTRVPKLLRDAFALACAVQATDMSHALRQFMLSYVAKHGAKRD